jgi:hypothetical protein
MLAMPLFTPDITDATNLLEQERTLFSVSLRQEDIPETRLTDKHRRVLSYWRSKIGAHGAAPRSDIDPCDIAPALPNLMLWETDGQPDYRCRLAGTEICHNTAGKMQGILLGDLPCPLMDEARREFDAVFDRGLATVAERTLHWLDRPLVYYRHLLLPLVDDRGRRHMLLSVMTFHRMAQH